MSNSSKTKLGVFGFGCVGQGLYNVLSHSKGIKAEIHKICIKNANKKRSLPDHYFTLDKNELLFDENIDVIVELIDDPVAALEIVKTALKNGKAVVTANKKMLADNFEELFRLQQSAGVPLLYEASSCGCIPIIRNLEEYYDNDQLSAVEGIFNGSTNYILTKMFHENVSFEAALSEAQVNGFAESDPSLDIGGFDAKYKLGIILAHSFGLMVKPDELFNYGITGISDFDANYAKEKGYKIKLISFCRKVGDTIAAGVLPRFIAPESKLYSIDNEYNAVMVESIFSEYQYFVGKGAGSNPTGSAVLSDISALTYNYRYEYKKYQLHENLRVSNDFFIQLYIRYNPATPLPENIFEEVSEQYISHNNAYMIGSVNFERLIQSGIVGREDVNIIAAADPRIHGGTRQERSELPDAASATKAHVTADIEHDPGK